MRTSNFDHVYMEFFEKRFRKAVLLILLVFCVLILRLWFLQIVNGSTYRSKSEDNRIHLQDIPSVRGKIFDRNGELLVGNRPSYDLHVIPEGIQDSDQLSESLNRFLSLKPKVIEQKLKGSSGRNPFRHICIKKDMPPNELAMIETNRFNLPGVMIKVKPQRHYVYNDFASHLLGYVGLMDEDQLKSGRYPGCKPGDLVGKSGVELKWQSFLTGIRGGEQAEVDASGRTIRVIARKPPISGANIFLTIDKGMQAIAQKALTDKTGAIIAMDPHTGAILALASSPSFNPNLFIEGIDKTRWKSMVSSKDFPLQNRALAGQYPPGSLFKIIVALAGLEEGVIRPGEEHFCNGQYRLGRGRYHCWKKFGHGKVNLHKALVQSCDIYFYKLGKKLGIEKIAQYACKFSLGKTTGFGMGQEKPGLIPTSEWKLKKYGVPWQGGETISVSIGQSFVLVTPIQMVTIISSVFNGGKLYQPQVTKWVGKNESQKIYEFSPKLIETVEIKPEHMDIVRNALIGAVNASHGTARMAGLKHITVAGKTGTAQVVSLEKEKKFNNGAMLPAHFKDHGWFIAVAPAENPIIALTIIIEHGGHGGAVAAPIARQLIQYYLELNHK